MFQKIFTLYSKCFPNYPVTEELFNDLLKPEKAQIFQKSKGENLIGFSIVHGCSISLLCVDEKYRRQGIGTELLTVSEQYIRDSGANNIYLGRGKHYLLQGVPTDHEETVPFFQKHGYSASWTSTNMQLDLEDFSSARLDIPCSPKDVIYRFATPEDTFSLFEAIQETKSGWKNVYETCSDPIFIAVRDKKVIGFEVLSPTGGRFGIHDEKVGCIGCVGVIPSERKKGIGRRMVVHGIEWLKLQNCSYLELRYVEIVDWYRKIGFLPTRLQWMGEKAI